MNREKTKIYEAPVIEIIEVQVEKGFAASVTPTFGVGEYEEENWL